MEQLKSMKTLYESEIHTIIVIYCHQGTCKSSGKYPRTNYCTVHDRYIGGGVSGGFVQHLVHLMKHILMEVIPINKVPWRLCTNIVMHQN